MNLIAQKSLFFDGISRLMLFERLIHSFLVISTIGVSFVRFRYPLILTVRISYIFNFKSYILYSYTSCFTF